MKSWHFFQYSYENRNHFGQILRFFCDLKLVKVHYSMDHFRDYEQTGTSKFCDVIQGTCRRATCKFIVDLHRLRLILR